MGLGTHGDTQGHVWWEGQRWDGHPGEQAASQQAHLQNSYILPLLRKRKKNRQYYICHTINKVNSHSRGNPGELPALGCAEPPLEGCTETLGCTETPWRDELRPWSIHRNHPRGCTETLGCMETPCGMRRGLRVHRNHPRECTETLGCAETHSRALCWLHRSWNITSVVSHAPSSAAVARQRAPG